MDYLWVDAICINQSDGEEKNQQVRAMNRVYSNAVEVTAWLGLQRLPGWIKWREAAAKTSEHGDWLLSENVLEVAERPYWSRMWIVQELLLAQRIRFQTSWQAFDFDHFADVVDEKRLSGTEDLRQLLAYTKARRADHGHPHRPLWELLLDFATCQCQDPRDNVFALLSLLSYPDQDALSSFFRTTP